MKTTTLARPTRSPSRLRRASRIAINPHVFSLMSLPFPVFVTDETGKIVPTITLPEIAQITHYKE